MSENTASGAYLESAGATLSEQYVDWYEERAAATRYDRGEFE